MTEPELIELLKDVDGRLVAGQEFWLYQKVFALREDASVLEIGTLHGRSTCAMAFACVGTQKRIFTVDIDPIAQGEAQRQLFRLGLDRYVITGCFDSALLEKIFGWCLFDFAFIDGDHEYASVYRDFSSVLKLMIPGGRIAFHDVVETWPGSKRAWDEHASQVLQNHEFCTTIASGTV